MFSFIQKIKISLSFTGIVYVWILPCLSKIGFTEKNATSISGFICNPQATGAMAAVSFLPFILMNEYQYIYSNKKDNILDKTLLLFEISYGMFLSFPVSYISIKIHEISVICFSLSFIIHSYFILYDIQFNKITKVLLSIGSICFMLLSILNPNHLIYWFVECICFTCMILFTPIDWYLFLRKEEKIPLLNI